MNPVVSAALDVARNIAVAVVPGAPEAIRAVESVRNLVTAVKQATGDPAEHAALDAELDALEAKVFARADGVADRLEG